MKQFVVKRPLRSLELTVIISLVVVLLATANGKTDTEKNPLIQRAEENLAATRNIAATVTNEADKVIWQRRTELSEKELENVKQRLALEQRERDMTQAQSQLGARHLLREFLRTIDTDTREAEERNRELDRKIRKMQTDRAEMASKAAKKGDSDEEVQERAEDEQQLQNLDAQIRALVAERDSTDYQIHLAQEATRIDQALRVRELSPRPTVRQIFEMRRQAAVALKAIDDERTLVDILEKQKQAADETLALSQQRFSHLDEEVQTLESLYNTGRKGLFDFTKATPELDQRQRQTREILAESRSQRRFLQPRIESQNAQVVALDSGLGTIRKLEELLTREYQFVDQEKADVIHRFLQRITLPSVIILSLLMLHVILRRIILPMALKSESLFVSRRVVTYVIGLLVIVVITMFFLEDLKSIATILGLAGAAVVIALQDLCSSFAGWFVIMTSRKIQVGDRIEVNEHRGDVIDIQMLRTTLLEVGNWLGTDEATGRIVVIPNSFIFKNHFFNYSHMHPYIWGKVEVTVTFETPAKAARELLLRILTEETRQEIAEAKAGAASMEKEYGMQDAVYEPRITSIINSNGVQFGLFYVSHYKLDDEVRNRITSRILAEFEKHPEFHFAYVTRRELTEPSAVRYAQAPRA